MVKLATLAALAGSDLLGITVRCPYRSWLRPGFSELCLELLQGHFRQLFAHFADRPRESDREKCRACDICLRRPIPSVAHSPSSPAATPRPAGRPPRLHVTRAVRMYRQQKREVQEGKRTEVNWLPIARHFGPVRNLEAGVWDVEERSDSLGSAHSVPVRPKTYDDGRIERPRSLPRVPEACADRVERSPWAVRRAFRRYGSQIGRFRTAF